MKRIIAIILTVLITAALCACSDPDPAPSDGKSKKGNSETSSQAAFSTEESTSSEKPDPTQTETGASVVWGKADEPQPAGRLFESGDFVFLDLGDQTAYAMSYRGNGPEVVFPAEVDGLSVTGIWSYALTDAKGSVSKVTLPASVKKIAFSALTKIGLIQIEVDAENQYLSSVDGVLYSKDKKNAGLLPRRSLLLHRDS